MKNSTLSDNSDSDTESENDINNNLSDFNKNAEQIYQNFLQVF